MSDHLSASDALLLWDEGAVCIPIRLISPDRMEQTLSGLSPFEAGLATAAEFSGKPAQLLLLPDTAGKLSSVLFGVGDEGSDGRARVRELPVRLPTGDYVFADVPHGSGELRLALAWAQGAYVFDRYKRERGKLRPHLRLRSAADIATVRRIAHACALARDMVNTPASDMGPLQIETIAREIAERYGANCKITTGQALLDDNYPAVHGVGRAAALDRAPRMIELDWTRPNAAPDAPVVAVVGKGVTFDTGGLDLKPSAGMRLMKKDMGGAAHALALARMVMDAGLPVRLITLVPAVENAVSADAVRPGDVLSTRAGLSVEVGNTDAEGRLILADALTRAAEFAPVLTIDLATLTGAARVALGPEVIPFYTASDALATELSAAAANVADPLWRMPLWAGYASSLESDVAELKNDPDAWAQAGSVTAALFLQRFAPTSGEWVHFDIFAWNPKGAPGKPVGAAAQAIRALFHLLQQRFPTGTPTP